MPPKAAAAGRVAAIGYGLRVIRAGTSFRADTLMPVSRSMDRWPAGSDWSEALDQ